METQSSSTVIVGASDSTRAIANLSTALARLRTARKTAEFAAFFCLCVCSPLGAVKARGHQDTNDNA